MSVKKRVVLVTGGHGFIGHHLVKQLVANGDEVIVIDNHFIYPTILKEGKAREHSELIYNRIEAIKAIGPYTFIRGDVRADWKELLTQAGVDPNRITHLVHLANIPRQAEAQVMPNETADIMTLGTLQINRLVNLEKAIFVSSSMVYGDFTSPIKEDGDVNPKGMYGTSRLIGEHLFKALMREHPNKEKLASFIIRPTAVYGPGDSTIRVIGKFVKAAIMGEELHVRGKDEVMDFTHVADVVKGLRLVLDTKRGVGEATTTYNVSRGQEVNTIFKLATIAIDVANTDAMIVLKEKDVSMPSRHLLDASKISEDLGYESKWSLEAGIESVYADLKIRLVD